MVFPHTEEEKALMKEGFNIIAGIDEAGRGPLAGPVVAAAVLMPLDSDLIKVKDSKLLSEKQRETLFEKILENCLDHAVGVVESEIIDEINIYQASKLAMLRAVEGLRIKPDYILVDAMKVETKIPQKSLVKGDLTCYSIAAASIVAKVTRDRLMKDYHQKYPKYGFDSHKGYGTKDHLRALREYGPSEIHRFTYKPVYELLSN